MNVSLLNVANTFPHIALTIGILFLFLSPVTIIGNGLVLASILCDPYKNIRSAPSSYIIFNLALADLLVGVLVEPIFVVWIFHTITEQTEFIVMKLVSPLTYLLLGVSICTLVFLSADRLIAIRTPLQYGCTVSKNKYKVVNISTWIYFAVYAICIMEFQSQKRIFRITAIVHVVTLPLALSILNIVVVYYVRIRGRILTKTLDSENTAAMQTAFNREKTVARTTGIMVAAFLICVFLYGVISTVNLLFEKEDGLEVQRILTWMYYAGLTLIYLNSLMNPFIYAWRLPKYKKAFRYFVIQIKNKLSVSAMQNERVWSSHCAEEPNYKCKHTQRSRELPRSHIIYPPEIKQTICHSKLEGIAKYTERDDKTVENTKL